LWNEHIYSYGRGIDMDLGYNKIYIEVVW